MVLRKVGQSTRRTQLKEVFTDFFKGTRENSIFSHAVLKKSLKISLCTRTFGIAYLIVNFTQPSPDAIRIQYYIYLNYKLY